MQIDFTVTLDYGWGEPNPDEPTPEGEDIARAISVGLEAAGWPSVNVRAQRAS